MLVREELQDPKQEYGVHSMYQYHAQAVRFLGSGPLAQRLELCNFSMSVDGSVVTFCFFAEEAQSSGDGVNNTSSSRAWPDENLHATVCSNFKLRYIFRVSCAVLGDQLIGPFIFKLRLTGLVYQRFL